MTPRATYRVQLRPGFGFGEAAELADYLAALGVSHFYASPVLEATPGSEHGYDVVDPTRVRDELGGAGGLAKLSRALSDAGLSMVLDVVPNHMAIGGPYNRWWWDVLENGPSSQYADYFDVEWVPPDVRSDNRILLPILGDHYGRVLEAGELRIERSGGTLRLRYYDHELPVAPRSLSSVLARAAEIAKSDDLAFLASAFEALPLPTATDRASTRRRHRDKEVLARLLAQRLEENDELAGAMDAAVTEINADPDRLDDLLSQQAYRLALWRTAGRELGYRRFFDINGLAGIRAEDEWVFSDTHALVVDWVRRGMLDGLRIDHPDGIRDPELYLRRLRTAVGPETWIVVEKILHPGEKLPASWPVHGTTGYDFAALLAGLFVDARAEEAFTRLYEELTGETASYERVVRKKKHLVMRDTLGSELNRLTELMLDVCERHRRHRDYTRDELLAALRELVACFPVYRSYVRAESGELSDQDRAYIATAVAAARENRPEIDPELFAFLEDLLLLRVRGEPESDLVMRLQQVTGAVMAKGAEDTAFYCHARFVALNEVGGDPGVFGGSLDAVHAELERRAETLPESMLGISTHDTKRSEDVRARLYVLSEMPEEWAERARALLSRAARHGKDGAPDRNDRYLLLQNLIGAWPIEAERMKAYALKAVKEAKRHTSWTRPDEAYEAAVAGFVEGVLEDRELTDAIDGFVRSLAPDGRITSLSMKLIALTAPGVPDLYQGTELWDHSLVDPDNRRPVDFARRRRLLAELERLGTDEILARMDEGLPKLWITRQALRVRRERPEAFAAGAGHRRLAVQGAKAAHAVAFARGDAVVTIAPRLVRTLGGDWADTTVTLPEGNLENVLDGTAVSGGRARLAQLLARFPLALLVRRD